MYTPHFFSKIQMLLGPNLAHLLGAQDQGGEFKNKLLNLRHMNNCPIMSENLCLKWNEFKEVFETLVC